MASRLSSSYYQFGRAGIRLRHGMACIDTRNLIADTDIILANCGRRVNNNSIIGTEQNYENQ